MRRALSNRPAVSVKWSSRPASPIRGSTTAWPPQHPTGGARSATAACHIITTHGRGFIPVFTDTHAKADSGRAECSCRSEGSSVHSSSAVRLSRRASWASAVPRWPGSWGSGTPRLSRWPSQRCVAFGGTGAPRDAAKAARPAGADAAGRAQPAGTGLPPGSRTPRGSGTSPSRGPIRASRTCASCGTRSSSGSCAGRCTRRQDRQRVIRAVQMALWQRQGTPIERFHNPRMRQRIARQDQTFSALLQPSVIAGQSPDPSGRSGRSIASTAAWAGR